MAVGAPSIGMGWLQHRKQAVIGKLDSEYMAIVAVMAVGRTEAAAEALVELLAKAMAEELVMKLEGPASKCHTLLQFRSAVY